MIRLPSKYLTVLQNLPRASGDVTYTAQIKTKPEDFYVEEVLGFEPGSAELGQSEHVFLWVEKRGANSTFVAEQLAKLAGISPKAVSFAGLKDRHAVTRQWFSLHMPGQGHHSLLELKHDEFSILKAERHNKKLKRGVHQGNRFTIVLRNVDGDVEKIQQRFMSFAENGFPNYFAEQRFGRNYSNLHNALLWFAKELRPKASKKGFYLSAARSFLFNAILSERINSNQWCAPIEGDVFMLDGSQSIFTDYDDSVLPRLASGDVHITASLPGEGRDLQISKALMIENEILTRYDSLFNGIIAQRAKREQRSLRVIPKQLNAKIIDTATIELSFYLPKGSFATALLAELVLLKTSDEGVE